MANQIKIKNSIIDPFLVSHQSDLTASSATVTVRYHDIVSNIIIYIENRFVVVEHEYHWDGTQAEFDQLMTSNLAEAMTKFKRIVAHNACLDNILQRRTT